SSFYAGVAGALYSGLLGYMSPEGFDLFQMIIQKAMIVVGGLGSIVGSVLGAALLVYIMEFLREFKSTQEIVFGVLLVGFMVFQPNGLVVFMKRWLPGWEEPLHLAGRRAQAGAANPGLLPEGSTPGGDRLVGRTLACSQSMGLRSRPEACAPSTAFRPRSEPGRLSASSGPTAPARRRCST